MEKFTLNGKTYGFEYSLETIVSGTCFDIMRQKSLLEGNPSNLRYPFDYDYIRVFHGTFRNVFYSRPHKPDIDEISNPIVMEKGHLANSFSILKQGYYRSRNDALSPENSDKGVLDRWKNKIGSKISNKTNGMYCSWLPPDYGNIVFDIVVPASDVRINIEGVDGGISSSRQLNERFNSPEEFIKDVNTYPEKFEVVLDEKIPLDNIIGVSVNNSSRGFEFLSFDDFVSNLDPEKLPGNNGSSRKDIRKFEELKKVYELFNEGSTEPTTVLRAIDEAILLFSIYRNRSLPGISIKNYEMPYYIKNDVNAHSYVKNNTLAQAREYGSEKRKKALERYSDKILNRVEAYNEMVYDIHEILDIDTDTAEISGLGQMRSLTRAAVERHNINYVVSEDFQNILEDHKKRIENGKPISEKEERSEEKTLEKLAWFPLIELESPLKDAVEKFQ